MNRIMGWILHSIFGTNIHSDEDVAKEILKKLSEERIRVQAVDNHWTVPRKYGFDIEGFSITAEVHYMVKSGNRTYVIEVDGNLVDSSQYTNKRIFKKSAETFNLPEDQDEYEPVKDFRKAFRTKN
jgi:hypothetical protein